MGVEPIENRRTEAPKKDGVMLEKTVERKTERCGVGGGRDSGKQAEMDDKQRSRNGTVVRSRARRIGSILVGLKQM